MKTETIFLENLSQGVDCGLMLFKSVDEGRFLFEQTAQKKQKKHSLAFSFWKLCNAFAFDRLRSDLET